MADSMNVKFILHYLFSALLLTFCRGYYPYEDIIEVLDQYPLPSLNYGYSDLEPHIDRKTVQVHHGGHHRAYTNKMNAALKEWRASVGKFHKSASYVIGTNAKRAHISSEATCTPGP